MRMAIKSIITDNCYDILHALGNDAYIGVDVEEDFITSNCRITVTLAEEGRTLGQFIIVVPREWFEDEMFKRNVFRQDLELKIRDILRMAPPTVEVPIENKEKDIWTL